MTYGKKKNSGGNGNGYRNRNEFNNQAANQNNQPVKYEGFKPRNEKQEAQAATIDKNDISFCLGSAGTGKTHVAIAKAVEALNDKDNKIGTILIARPARESGEKIGFLKGDANEKLAPYMRPIYDEFDKIFGKNAYQLMIEAGTLEIVPIGLMRGRTFENAFIVIDEAQNATLEQLTMAVTRLGPNSKMVITGDPAQCDLTKLEGESGLQPLLDQLKGLEGIGHHAYTHNDIVRHPTVQRIVDRLEANKAKNNPPAPGG